MRRICVLATVMFTALLPACIYTGAHDRIGVSLESGTGRLIVHWQGCPDTWLDAVRLKSTDREGRSQQLLWELRTDERSFGTYREIVAGVPLSGFRETVPMSASLPSGWLKAKVVTYFALEGGRELPEVDFRLQDLSEDTILNGNGDALAPTTFRQKALDSCA